MPATQRQSIGPFRVTPTTDMQELTRSLNQQLALITTYLNDRLGFAGPTRFYNDCDVQGHAVIGYPDTPGLGAAASVAQLQAVQQQVTGLQQQVIVLPGTITTATEGLVTMADLDRVIALLEQLLVTQTQGAMYNGGSAGTRADAPDDEQRAATPGR